MTPKEKEEGIKKAVEILRSLGVELSVNGCGCCESPWVDMKFQGETILTEADNCNFNTEDEQWSKDEG